MAMPMSAPLDEATDDVPNDSAIEVVFDTLLRDIVSGVHAAGTRLPAERELSRRVGASRSTLREALRRLGEWNLIEPRRGSGIVVRPYRDWAMDVVGAYLRFGKPEPGQPSIAQMLVDLFALRRTLMAEMIRIVTPRVQPGGMHDARAAMARAWALRDAPTYVHEDFQVIRRVVEAAQFTPGLWLLNSFASLWGDAAASIRAFIRPPADYVATWTRMFELIEAHDADAACALITAYLERHDGALVGALSGKSTP
jgi:DNA-binding FadR family transcriptional regulator